MSIKTISRPCADWTGSGRDEDSRWHYHSRHRQGKPLQGTIVAVGKGTKDEEMVLKEGDTVLYGKYAGTELEFEGKKYLIMRQKRRGGCVWY